MRLVGHLLLHADTSVVGERRRRRRLCRLGGEVAEQLGDLLDRRVAEVAGQADDHPLGRVPVPDVVAERVARDRLDRLLGAEDVPAERLVAVDELVVHARDVVPRRVDVHVHLLDDHALLALDLLGVELGVAEHVDEDVEGDVAVLGRAADVVARVLLAGEGVELAADRVDLGRDVARRRAPLGALEEHVLGEVRDAVRLGRLVARAGREHHEARHGLDLRHRRRQDAEPVVQRLSLERRHRARWYRQAYEQRREDPAGDRGAARLARRACRPTAGCRPAGFSTRAAGRRSTPLRRAATPCRRSSSSCGPSATPTCSSASATRARRR